MGGIHGCSSINEHQIMEFFEKKITFNFELKWDFFYVQFFTSLQSFCFSNFKMELPLSLRVNIAISMAINQTTEVLVALCVRLKGRGRGVISG